MPTQLTAEDLLASGASTFTVHVPAALLRPSPGTAPDGLAGSGAAGSAEAAAGPSGATSAGASNGSAGNGTSGAYGPVAGDVVLRPLLVRDVDRVVRAAREQRMLASVLMVQQALVAPRLTVDQVGGLPAGVVQFLAEQVNRISGLALEEDDLERAVRAPLARACFILAREFGWTPAECSELTVGQVLLYLEMLAREERPADEAGA